MAGTLDQKVLPVVEPTLFETEDVSDGVPDQASINPAQDKAVNKMGAKSIYNLNVGEYDVAITVGASYNTKRIEAADSMVQLVQAQPELMPVIGDLLVKAMDWPGAEEIANRLKTLLPPEIKALENKEMPREVQAIMEQAEQASIRELIELSVQERVSALGIAE